MAGRLMTRRMPARVRAVFTRVVAVVVAVVVLAGCGNDRAADPGEPQTSASAGTVQMRVLDSAQGTLALVPVTIAGRGPYLFALDTGASARVVDADIAQQLSLPETGERRPVTGIIGNQQVSLVRVERWAVGDVTLEATDMARVNLPDPDRGTGLQGLLGSDVLSDFGSLRIDYDQQRLYLGSS